MIVALSQVHESDFRVEWLTLILVSYSPGPVEYYCSACESMDRGVIEA